jgi:uncharacterized protein YkwD
MSPFVKQRLRSHALGALLTIAVFGSMALASSPASGTVAVETELAGRINQERAAAGLPALVVQAKLIDKARGWSQKMSVASGPNRGPACRLSHNPRLATEIPIAWTALGENVGCSANNVEALHQAFMNSPEHRKNILDSKFDSVGVAIVMADTTMFVTEVFMQTDPNVATPTSTNSAGTKPTKTSSRPVKKKAKSPSRAR